MTEIPDNIRLVPCDKGIAQDEMMTMLNEGWVLIGRQSMNTGVARPDNPGGVVDMDIWMIQEPMMPQRVVAETLVSYYQNIGGKQVLDQLTQAMFNIGIEKLDEEVMKIVREAENEQ